MNAKIPRTRTESPVYWEMLADFVNLIATQGKQQINKVFYFILFAGSNNIDLTIV
jgi:hypothetical protein